MQPGHRRYDDLTLLEVRPADRRENVILCVTADQPAFNYDITEAPGSIRR